MRIHSFMLHRCNKSHLWEKYDSASMVDRYRAESNSSICVWQKEVPKSGQRQKVAVMKTPIKDATPIVNLSIHKFKAPDLL